MSVGKDPATLQKAIGYTFETPALLTEALTHSSYTNECKAKGVRTPCNERLEFLGDAVLQIRISDELFTRYPDCAEGFLTKMRQVLVCEGTLAGVAKRICLGEYLYLGKGEEQTHGRERESILADAFEALLAAVYLDSGKDEAFIRLYLLRLMEKEISHSASGQGGDYKSRLQQLVQQDGSEHLEYLTVGETCPDHNKTYTVEARINSNVVGRGTGHTKKEAEMAAAKEALALFGIRSEG